MVAPSISFIPAFIAANTGLGVPVFVLSACDASLYGHGPFSEAHRSVMATTLLAFDRAIHEHRLHSAPTARHVDFDPSSAGDQEANFVAEIAIKVIKYAETCGAGRMGERTFWVQDGLANVVGGDSFLLNRLESTSAGESGGVGDGSVSHRLCIPRRHNAAAAITDLLKAVGQAASFDGEAGPGKGDVVLQLHQPQALTPGGSLRRPQRQPGTVTLVHLASNLSQCEGRQQLLAELYSVLRPPVDGEARANAVETSACSKATAATVFTDQWLAPGGVERPKLMWHPFVDAQGLLSNERPPSSWIVDVTNKLATF